MAAGYWKDVVRAEVCWRLSRFGKKVENGGTGVVDVGCVDCGGGGGFGRLVFGEG